ncbi:DUF502 domain-containing protein [Methylophaga sulfidovorans]|uniref:Uncharacterized membrane protein n=1 Tax=Methylophaga sulfidovorans TaxID=45496 RepID=A0A1I3XLR1_9GAMM|nr:DUF502 domain-containing protein [Methylophaga sulfidovorans]SFK19981.1 Uncharacterized membrane protein [Methylophaga sulfidovorans]
MFRFLTRQFLTGLITILPITITLYLLYWVITSTEQALSHVIKFILPDYMYWPGMGFLAAIALIFSLGIMMRLYVFKRLFKWAESLLYHLPVIKSIYGSMHDFFHYFTPGRETEFEQVVSVKLDNGMEMIGFITVDSVELLPTQGDEERVLVYLPMSYNIGGYPVIIPRRMLKPVDMTMEQAMRFVLTAGVAGHTKPK